MKRILLLCMVALIALPSFGIEVKTEKEVDAYLLPALYKDKSVPYQKVKVVVRHTGAKQTITVQLDNQSKQVEVTEGANIVLFDIPEVKAPAVAVAKFSGKTIQVPLKPLRQWKVNFVQHTHTDIGYTRPQNEILAEQLRYIDYALDYCDATDHLPDNVRFRWTCEISWAVNEYLKNRPAAQVERLKKRVKEGRIEIAALYLNFDELPDELSLASSFYPLKQFRKEGLKSEIAMQNDVMGVSWLFTEIMQDMGIKYLNMGMNGDHGLFPFDLPTIFWWESPSGKKLLTYKAEHYHTGNMFKIHTDEFDVFEDNLLSYLSILEDTDYPFDISVIQHSGYHTDNSPPSTSSTTHAIRWNEKYEWPKVRIAVASEFFKTVENQYAEKLKTYRGAWPDSWTDGFASGAREAAVSRITHSNVIANQTGFSFAKLWGAKLPEGVNDQIAEINKALLFYDEHTFGSSKSVTDPYGKSTWDQRSLKMSYAWEAYRRVGLVGEFAMGLLQSYIPKANVPSIALFNALNWPYTGIAQAYIDHQILPRNKAFEIVDAQGRICPAQPGERRSDGTYWSIYVKDVPPLGYTQLYIRVKDQPAEVISSINTPQGRAPFMTKPRHENQWYDIRFNPSTGTISQIIDKELGQALLEENTEWAFGQFVYENMHSRRDMIFHRPMKTFTRPIDKIRLESITRGPIWDSYLFVGEALTGREADNFKADFRVYNVEKKIEIVYSLRKRSVLEPEAVYIAFPFEVADGKLFIDVPGGNIEAGVDQIPNSSRDWNTVQNYAAARNSKSQIVLVSPEVPMMHLGGLNTGKWKRGKHESTQIYSMPMSNYWHTNFNADQLGEFNWSYFITSTNDVSTQYATQFAWNNRIPLLTRVFPEGNTSGAPLTPASFFSLPDNLLIVSMSPVEGENAIMLHLREIGGKACDFTVRPGLNKFKSSTVCNAIGTPLANRSLAFKPWEVKFIKLTW